VSAKPAAIAIANKTARIAWAIMVQCSGKGAAIQIPGRGGLQAPVRGWPMVAT
jgi:hypothetical protein